MDCKEKNPFFLFLLIEEDLKSCDKRRPFFLDQAPFFIHSENDFKAKVMRSLQSHYESVSKIINIVKTFCPRKQSPI